MVAIESGSVWNSGIVHSLWNILSRRTLVLDGYEAARAHQKY